MAVYIFIIIFLNFVFIFVKYMRHVFQCGLKFFLRNQWLQTLCFGFQPIPLIFIDTRLVIKLMFQQIFKMI